MHAATPTPFWKICYHAIHPRRHARSELRLHRAILSVLVMFYSSSGHVFAQWIHVVVAYLLAELRYCSFTCGMVSKDLDVRRPVGACNLVHHNTDCLLAFFDCVDQTNENIGTFSHQYGCGSNRQE